MKAADLRKSILQATVQGKLVPHNPPDEPATTLLERIRKEKAQLFKEVKIKKEKPLPPISEDELPFDLPEGWAWCRLGEIVQIINGDRGKNYPSKNKLSATGIPFVSALNIQNHTISKSNLLCLNQKQYEILGNGKLTLNDIVFCIRGSLGKFGIYPFSCGAIASSLVIIRRYFEDDDFLRYMMLYLTSPILFNEIKKYDNGTAQPNLAAKDLSAFLFPLPPSAEQKSIAKKANELMSLCCELETAEKELNILESNFAEYLPKSILQAAVQGKLVPQNIHDEPADKLLERIKSEKAKLIKSGKLKKEKPLLPITEAEIPYDLPDGWIWCRLGEVIEKNTGGGTPSKRRSDYWGGDIPWASVKDMNVEYITKTEDSITIKGLENSSTSLIEEGSIIVCTRMGLGKIAVNTIPLAINQDLRALRLSAFIDKQYFILAYKTFAITGSGMTVKGIKIDELHSFLLPLPPLAEQQRIVIKVNELIALCDALKAAHEAPVGNLTVAKMIPFPQPEGEPEMLMAARGKMPKAPSKALQDARNRLLED